MKTTQTTATHDQFSRTAFCSIVMTATVLLILIFGSSSPLFAQSTFTGDYDRTFAAPNGYFVDP